MHTWGRRGRALAGLAGAVALALGTVTGCASQHQPSPDGKIRVVVGFYPLQFVAEQVGGARVRVKNLSQPGAEPHDLELSPRQVADVADADLVVYLGGFQPAVDQATAQEARGRAFDVADMVTLRPAVVVPHPADEPPDEEAAEGDTDPHVWLDPTRLARVVDAVADRLTAVDPSGAATYHSRAANLHSELSKLDSDYARGLHSCARREIVVSHAAFGYLAERYGLEQIAISGLSPDAEPTPRRLAAVAEQARQHSATTIFFETLASPKVAQAIAREVGASTAVLDPIEGLPAGSRETYLSVMRHNLSTLKTALACP